MPRGAAHHLLYCLVSFMHSAEAGQDNETMWYTFLLGHQLGRNQPRWRSNDARMMDCE
jgi:hypothetical protein